MPLLTDADRAQLEGTFRLLKTPVRLAFFTQALNCETCEVAKQILEEVQALSDLITLEEHNFLLEKDAAAGYGIDRVPAIAVLGEHDHGIRFYGAPHGYEFASLLEAILLIGGAEDVGLSDQSRALLTDVREPVDIQVFVTPTWPHCPRAVSLALRMAMENDKVRTSVVGAAEFPEMVRRYHINGVPKTVVNETVEILGAQPEHIFVSEALKPFTEAKPTSVPPAPEL